MRTCYVGMTMLIILLIAASLSAQDLDDCPVKISQSTAVRNGTVSITVANPQKVTEGTIQLIGARPLPPITVALNNGTMAYTVPGDIPLGQYAVTVRLGALLFSACKSLRVSPALDFEPKLFPFEPKATYETETIRLPDKKSQLRKLKTVRLSLRGSGFIVDTPDDNQILINGEAHPVKWGNWTDVPDASDPEPGRIIGRVVSPEKIDLYRVPVPADGILRVNVKQGDRTTAMQLFTVYCWSRLPVAMASGVIAIVLALIVLTLVHVFIRTQPRESGYNVFKVLFLDPETATYSLSKLQFYFWTAAAIFGYSYLAISRMLVQGLSWPDMPSGLPGIIAIGAGTSVGAQVVTNLRGPKGAGSEHPNLGDFVTSGGVAAADRVQLLVWTLLGVGLFCISALKYAPGVIQELDPVPDGILAMMGLSAAGYLGGKFARKQGPVINDITITPKAADDDKTGAEAQKFIRIIELRGRNLSSEALLEIDGMQIPYRMLVKNANGNGQPEVVIREPDAQTLARVLRLSIEPEKLEGHDLDLYRSWFGAFEDKKEKTFTFTIINPDGQRSDASFTVTSAAGPSSIQNGRKAVGPSQTAEK